MGAQKQVALQDSTSFLSACMFSAVVKSTILDSIKGVNKAHKHTVKTSLNIGSIFSAQIKALRKIPLEWTLKKRKESYGFLFLCLI